MDYKESGHQHITGHNGTHLCRICGKEVDDYDFIPSTIYGDVLNNHLNSNAVLNNNDIEDYDDYDC